MRPSMHGTVSITTARGQLITNLREDDEIAALDVAAMGNPLGMFLGISAWTRNVFRQSQLRACERSSGRNVQRWDDESGTRAEDMSQREDNLPRVT